MLKALIGFGGIVLFLFALFLNNNLKNGEMAAVSLDDEKNAFGIIEGPMPCSWEVSPPERVMSENKSQAFVVEVSNAGDFECESALSLRAPGFDISPSKEEQKISLKVGDSGSISWIISPRKAGNYDIAVSDILNTKIFGINVTNMFGLSAVQAKSASFLGTIFGPMLTVPWWWDRLRQRKPKQDTLDEVKK